MRDFDGKAGRPTEMDALVAYLQMLGTLVDFKLYNEKANFAERHDHESNPNRPNSASDFVTTFWTPVFVGIFHRDRRSTRSGPATRRHFDEAAQMPLRED